MIYHSNKQYYQNNKLMDSIKELQYKKVTLKVVQTHVKVNNERYILTTSKDVIKVLNIVQCQNNKIVLNGNTFENLILL